MKKIRIMLFIGTITFFTYNASSQVNVSFYSSSLSKIGVGYNFSDKLRGELRIYSNTSIYDITPELVFCYNFVNKDSYKVYAGLGGVVNYFNGLVIPIGVQFTPIKEFNHFSLHIELQPLFDANSSHMLQSYWGIKYTF